MYKIKCFLMVKEMFKFSCNLHLFLLKSTNTMSWQHLLTHAKFLFVRNFFPIGEQITPKHF